MKAVVAAIVLIMLLAVGALYFSLNVSRGLSEEASIALAYSLPDLDPAALESALDALLQPESAPPALRISSDQLIIALATTIPRLPDDSLGVLVDRLKGGEDWERIVAGDAPVQSRIRSYAYSRDPEYKATSVDLNRALDWFHESSPSTRAPYLRRFVSCGDRNIEIMALRIAAEDWRLTDDSVIRAALDEGTDRTRRFTYLLIAMRDPESGFSARSESEPTEVADAIVLAAALTTDDVEPLIENLYMNDAWPSRAITPAFLRHLRKSAVDYSEVESFESFSELVYDRAPAWYLALAAEQAPDEARMELGALLADGAGHQEKVRGALVAGYTGLANEALFRAIPNPPRNEDGWTDFSPQGEQEYLDLGRGMVELADGAQVKQITNTELGETSIPVVKSPADLVREAGEINFGTFILSADLVFAALAIGQSDLAIAEASLGIADDREYGYSLSDRPRQVIEPATLLKMARRFFADYPFPDLPEEDPDEGSFGDRAAQEKLLRDAFLAWHWLNRDKLEFDFATKTYNLIDTQAN